jgi:protein-disulfide isomerase
VIRKFVLAGLALAMVPLTAFAAQDWNLTFSDTGRGHIVGNPQADKKVIAFVSYSCSHCAHFETESDGALRLGYIQPGKVSYEVRNILRNPLDLAAALAVECGPEDKFWGNFRAMFRAQDRWLQIAVNAPASQQQRWTTGTVPARMRAIADDLGFHELLEPRGYTRAQLDQCLGDQAAIDSIMSRFRQDTTQYEIPGTPSFAVNGTMLDGVHTWEGLQPALGPAGL